MLSIVLLCLWLSKLWTKLNRQVCDFWTLSIFIHLQVCRDFFSSQTVSNSHSLICVFSSHIGHTHFPASGLENRVCRLCLCDIEIVRHSTYCIVLPGNNITQCHMVTQRQTTFNNITDSWLTLTRAPNHTCHSLVTCFMYMRRLFFTLTGKDVQLQCFYYCCLVCRNAGYINVVIIWLILPPYIFDKSQQTAITVG